MEKRGYVHPDWTPDDEGVKKAEDVTKAIVDLEHDLAKKAGDAFAEKLKVDKKPDQN